MPGSEPGVEREPSHPGEVEVAVQPPWSKYSEYPPGHIAWRMGLESYVGDWFNWVNQLGEDARREYLLSLRPVPRYWDLFVAELYVMPSEDECDLDAAFELFNAGHVED